MIPRHRPPFGIGSLFRTLLRSLFSVANVATVEQRYQKHLDVEHAVWLPSARYGITRSIQFQLATDAQIICPAFNCGAVHHAVQECERPVHFADCARDSFLMNCNGNADGRQAVVLSEMFGQRFETTDLNRPLVRDAALRIFDLAMCIPTRADMRRLQPSDVAVLSFGLGKSLYAGWGGMALTNCKETSEFLRRRRDEDLSRTTVPNSIWWNAQLFARTVAHDPIIYAPLRALRNSQRGDDRATFSTASQEWHRPATGLHIRRSIENLESSDAWAEHRFRLCRDYAAHLEGNGHFQSRSPEHSGALSHFSLCIPAHARDAVCQHLWERDIDVATLFPFPADVLNAADFPAAARAASEVVNLPLSNQLTRRDVASICYEVRGALDSIPEAPCVASVRNRVHFR